jgi:hypothetical protein
MHYYLIIRNVYTYLCIIIYLLEMFILTYALLFIYKKFIYLYIIDLFSDFKLIILQQIISPLIPLPISTGSETPPVLIHIYRHLH